MQRRILNALPVILFALCGVAVSVMIQDIHRQLSADVTFTSFCNINSQINCDVVLMSPYAYLGGITVSLWAILFYVGVVVAALASVRFDKARQREGAARVVFGMSVLGLLFSIYMAVVAFFILGTLCLMCSALYLVSRGLFASAWRLRSATNSAHGGKRTGEGTAGNDKKVLLASLGAGALLIAFGAFGVLGGGSEPLDAEGIRQTKPDIYRWFMERPRVDVPTEGHSRGPVDAAVTLVEFSDFNCPHCAHLDETISQILRGKHPDLRVVFRHFPLSSDCNSAAKSTIHPTACLAAVAAECAGEQDRFWQYEHTLFANQGSFRRSDLVGYARIVGLDVAAFERCLESDEARARVENDAREGARLGVQSTPTIFLNGRRIEGAPKGDVLLDAITLARDEITADAR